MLAKWWRVNFGFKDKTLGTGPVVPITFGDWAKVFGYGDGFRPIPWFNRSSAYPSGV